MQNNHIKWLLGIHTEFKNTKTVEEILSRLGFSTHPPPDSRDGEPFCLSCAEFESLNSSDAIWSKAKQIQSALSAINDFRPELPFSFRLGVLYESTEAGQWKRYIFGELKDGVAVSVKVEAHGTVNLPLSDAEYQRRVARERERHRKALVEEATLYARAAIGSPTVTKLLKLLLGEQNPTAWGHIVDIIQDEMSGDLSPLVTKSQLRRFYRSINHPIVFGASARHAVSRKVPPSNPMQSAEAKKFAHDLAEKWIKLRGREPYTES